MRHLRPLVAGLAAASLALLGAGPPGPEALIARGDQAWSRRAEGHRGSRALPGPIGEALTAYEGALSAAPDSIEAHWKLLRALYFQGEYVLSDRDQRLEAFARGREVGQQGLDLLLEQAGLPAETDIEDPAPLATALAPIPDSARMTFWASVHWGLWGRTRGKVAAARQGVAKKVRDLAQLTILLDEEVENAGGHRVLGRLHHEAPKLPFVTGWVDRDEAVSHLKRAVELDPEDLLSRLYLAEALLEHHRERRAEAIVMLNELLASDPDPDFVVEEEKVLEDARAVREKTAG